MSFLLVTLGLMCHVAFVVCRSGVTTLTPDNDVTIVDDVTTETHHTMIPPNDRPGIKARLTQKGFDFAAEVGTDMLMKKLSKLVIPDFQEEIGVSDVYVTNIQVASFPRPSSALSPIPFPGYGLSWEATRLNPVITANYEAQFDLGFWTVTKAGTATFYGTDMAFYLDFFVGRDSDGRPTTEVMSCDCDGDVSLSFEGEWSDIMNLGANLFNQHLRSLISAQICFQATAEINVRLADQLSKIPLTPIIANDYFLDLSLMRFPNIQDDAVDVSFKGAVYAIEEVEEPPYVPPELPVFEDHDDKMAYVYITDYFVNTGLYAMFLNDLLKYNVTSDMVPEEFRGYLNTSCPGSLCIGTVFPQLSGMYPHGTIAVDLEATSAPVVHLDGKVVNVTMPVDGTVFAIVNGTKSPIFVVTLVVDGVFHVDIVKRKVILGVSSIEVERPTARVKESHIGDIGEGFFFESILRVALQQVIIPRLREFGENGIIIPRLKGVDFIHPELQDADMKGVLILSTDVGYQVKRKRGSRKRKSKGRRQASRARGNRYV